MQIVLHSLLVVMAFAISSCTVKDSVFGTKLDSETSINQKFSVPPVTHRSGGSIRFALIADSHQNYADLKTISRYVNNSGAQFVVHLGDFTNSGTRDEYEIFATYLKKFSIPIYVVPGNHDLTTTGYKLYQKVFGPLNSASSTSFGKLIFWNNNKLESKGLDYNFLEYEIASADPEKPVFIFQHQDPFNDVSFSESNNIQYHSLVTRPRKMIVFHGHLHRFYRQIVDGVPYFQISRVEGLNWALVDIEGNQITVSYCHELQCSVEASL